jgi:hypothetical protein
MGNNMSETITGSIVVNFVDNLSGDESLLNAQIDARTTGLNKGKTTFYPGDGVGFLLYPGANVQIDGLRSTAGQVSALGAQTVVLKEILTFADSGEAQLTQPVLGLGGYKWLGNDGGAITLSGERTIKVAQPVLGMLMVIYQARAFGYRLAGVPHPLNGAYEYPVLVAVDASVT